MSAINLERLPEEVDSLVRFVDRHRLVAAQVVGVGTSGVQLCCTSEARKSLVVFLLQ